MCSLPEMESVDNPGSNLGGSQFSRFHAEAHARQRAGDSHNHNTYSHCTVYININDSNEVNYTRAQQVAGNVDDSSNRDKSVEPHNDMGAIIGSPKSSVLVDSAHVETITENGLDSEAGCRDVLGKAIAEAQSITVEALTSTDVIKPSCKVHVRQRNSKQTPHAAIQKGYERLRESVDAWVAKTLEGKESDFGETYRRWLKLELEEGKLESLGLYDRKDLILDPKIPIADTRLNHNAWRSLVWLGSQAHCNYVIVSLVIWRFLEDLFEPAFPIGTSLGEDDSPRLNETDFLAKIYDVIAQSDGGRGPESTATRWRSQTTTALTKTLGFQDRQAQESDKLCRTLVKSLEDWITLDSSARKELSSTIVQPAIELHTAGRCSNHDYRLLLRQWDLRSRALDKYLKVWSMRHISTWRGTSSTDGIEALCGLCPGLYWAKITKESHEWVQLLSPSLIVRDTQQPEWKEWPTSPSASLPDRNTSASQSNIGPQSSADAGSSQSKKPPRSSNHKSRVKD